MSGFTQCSAKQCFCPFLRKPVLATRKIIRRQNQYDPPFGIALLVAIFRQPRRKSGGKMAEPDRLASHVTDFLVQARATRHRKTHPPPFFRPRESTKRLACRWAHFWLNQQGRMACVWAIRSVEPAGNAKGVSAAKQTSRHRFMPIHPVSERIIRVACPIMQTLPNP